VNKLTPFRRQADHPFQILNYLPGGVRGAAFGLCAVLFDAENCTFLIAAVGLLSGGSLFVCIYDLTRRRISAIFEHLALFLKSMDLACALC